MTNKCNLFNGGIKQYLSKKLNAADDVFARFFNSLPISGFGGQSMCKHKWGIPKLKEEIVYHDNYCSGDIGIPVGIEKYTLRTCNVCGTEGRCY